MSWGVYQNSFFFCLEGAGLLFVAASFGLHKSVVGGSLGWMVVREKAAGGSRGEREETRDY